MRAKDRGCCGHAGEDHPFDFTLMPCIHDCALPRSVTDSPRTARMPCRVVPKTEAAPRPPPAALTSPFFTVMDCRRGVISSLMLDRKF